MEKITKEGFLLSLVSCSLAVPLPSVNICISLSLLHTNIFLLSPVKNPFSLFLLVLLPVACRYLSMWRQLGEL